MSRYIDADALMQDINNSIDGMTTAGFTVDAEYLWGKLHDALEHAPSIDIVRCKECSKAHLTYDGDCKYCEEWKDDDGNYIEVYHDGDHFCSYGEHKADHKTEQTEREGE